MKKYFGFLLTLSGTALILYVVIGIFANARLIASNCVLRCGENNKACYGWSYHAICPCSSAAQTPGMLYSKTPTYGSDVGVGEVLYESVVCRSRRTCIEEEVLDSNVCYSSASKADLSVTYLCVPFPHSKCTSYTEDETPSSYMNCVDLGCGE